MAAAGVSGLDRWVRGQPTYPGELFDLASRPEGEGEPTAEAASLFSVLGGRSCDYQGTVLPDPPSIFAE